MRKIVLIISLSLVCGFTGAFIYGKLFFKVPDNFAFQETNGQPVNHINYKGAALNAPDFVKASETATPSVVFIKTLSNGSTQRDYWDFWDFFGNQGPIASSGSGVIISADGYIVTNNHVIEGADDIEVQLSNSRKAYKAKVIGIDPNTDLALLKIEASGLPKATFSNSENLRIGEWVLAVGNPFNLTSTVTAGIVSAKGRSLHIVNTQFPIESFIQTDAAINPGNSGGALVNGNGELVGINTAIYTKTGSYSGYGFAIPANIVQKVVKDLIDFGEVQRAFTGMAITDIDDQMAQKLDKNINGVYVAQIYKDGPAYKAGIKEGDVIQKVNGKTIENKTELDEQIAYLRPGDKVKVDVNRKGSLSEYTIGLTNEEGNTDIIKRQTTHSDILGADFEAISKVEREKYGVKGGYRISNIRGGRIRQMGLPDGFVILSLNKVQYEDVNELIKDFERIRGQISIEGIHPDRGRMFYSFFSY